MGFDDYACHMIRRKAGEGKRCVTLHTEAQARLAEAITEDRTNLRYMQRVNVAFMTDEEYRSYQDLAKTAHTINKTSPRRKIL